MSSSWDEFLPPKLKTLGVVGRFWAKIHHGTPLESIFWKNHFLRIFDFWIVGLWTLSAEFWFIRPNIGRSSIFSENILTTPPLKMLPVIQLIFLNIFIFVNFCQIPYFQVYSILARSSSREVPTTKIYLGKKYKVRAFQRRVERTCSPLQCWYILTWTSKSLCNLSFEERFHMYFPGYKISKMKKTSCFI